MQTCHESCGVLEREEEMNKTKNRCPDDKKFSADAHIPSDTEAFDKKVVEMKSRKIPHDNPLLIQAMDEGSPDGKPVAARDFAASSGSTTSEYRFGLHTERAIKRLREFADRLERKEYILQGVEFSQKAVLNDYTLSTLSITYAEKYAAPAVENNLPLDHEAKHD
jgi:hypothetical protein